MNGSAKSSALISFNKAGSQHPFAGVELVPSSKRSVCHLYFNLAPLLIFYVDPGQIIYICKLYVALAYINPVCLKSALKYGTLTHPYNTGWKSLTRGKQLFPNRQDRNNATTITVCCYYRCCCNQRKFTTTTVLLCQRRYSKCGDAGIVGVAPN